MFTASLEVLEVSLRGFEVLEVAILWPRWVARCLAHMGQSVSQFTVHRNQTVQQEQVGHGAQVVGLELAVCLIKICESARAGGLQMHVCVSCPCMQTIPGIAIQYPSRQRRSRMDRPEADSGHDADARNDSILAHDRSSVSMMLMGDDSGRTSVGTRTSIPLDSFARLPFPHMQRWSANLNLQGLRARCVCSTAGGRHFVARGATYTMVIEDTSSHISELSIERSRFASILVRFLHGSGS